MSTTDTTTKGTRVYRCGCTFECEHHEIREDAVLDSKGQVKAMEFGRWVSCYFCRLADRKARHDRKKAGVTGRRIRRAR